VPTSDSFFIHRSPGTWRYSLTSRRTGPQCIHGDRIANRRNVAAALALAVLTGCAGKGNWLTGGSSAGQLKASVSHLQYENEQLRTEVAKLKAESRGIEDRLVQEQIHNGDLAARLDDARNLISDRGIDGGTLLGSRNPDRSSDAESDESPRSSVPARRTNRKPRKPPAARIPGEIDDLPSASGEAESDEAVSMRARGPASSDATFRDDWRGPALREDQLRWQPVATAAEPKEPARR
jgi:hypothetical protein